MLQVIIGLASLSLVSAILPDSVMEWITDKAVGLVMLIAEPVINIFVAFFDGIRTIVKTIFF